MGREPGHVPDPAESPESAAEAEASEAEARPTADSEGVYYISVSDFEARLPRTNPPPRKAKPEAP